LDNPENRERMLDVWLGLTGQAPLPQGPLLLPVLSGSMRPAIPLGSTIRIKAGNGSLCRVGDVTVYLDGNRLVAHRVLWIIGLGKTRWIFQKGDANRFGHWITAADVKGVVREVFPAEDVGAAFPGKDPFSLAAAAKSRREFLHNGLLAPVRLIQRLVTGKKPPKKEE
jgi:hypothetical protein